MPQGLQGSFDPIQLSPDVLRRAVDHFNWKPITLGHDGKKVLGSTMNASFKDGVVYSDLLLWDPAFLRAKALAISPGGFTYRQTDGIVHEITDLNHIALCQENRLGPRVSIGAA